MPALAKVIHVQVGSVRAKTLLILHVVPLLRERVRSVPAWLPLVLAAGLLLADQLLKAWALSNLQQGAPAIPVIPGILDWVLTFNTGAAWSMFSGSAVPLAVIRLLVGLGLLVYVTLRPQTRFLSLVLSLIAAGAIGNAIDGLRFGKVTDMIHAPFLSAITRALGQGDFPIFNLADMCVVLGTALLLAASFRKDPPR
ncbi:signal peptidase II [Deinococcus deserti]